MTYVNTAKQKMLEGKPAFGFSLYLGSPIAAEAMARSGIDFLLVDTQHGSWGQDATIAAFMGITGGTAVPMSRVAKNDYTLIGQLLDQGCMGIVVPMVHTAAQAKAAADAVRYPPRGDRSWGVGRARNLGDDYLSWADEQVYLAVQIESATAVENAEAIMATPGVDGCWVGPADLALSLGFHPSEARERDEHARALEQVVQACRNTGKIAGLSCGSPEEALRRAGQGFQFLTAGVELGMMLAAARNAVQALDL